MGGCCGVWGWFRLCWAGCVWWGLCCAGCVWWGLCGVVVSRSGWVDGCGGCAGEVVVVVVVQGWWEVAVEGCVVVVVVGVGCGRWRWQGEAKGKQPQLLRVVIIQGGCGGCVW